MKRLTFTGVILMAAAGFCIGSSGIAHAAVLKVPTDYSNIYNALAAASDGDEIHVANNYNETEAWLDTTGKSVSIISYAPDFSAPAPGATWDTTVGGGVDDALLTIENGTISVEGFSVLQASDGNVFFLKSDAHLQLNDCVVSGTVRSDTAGIKTAPSAMNIQIDIEGTTFTANGRGIWFNKPGGTTSINISDSAFLANKSYPIEWRTIAGNHTFNMQDTYFTITNNRQVRLLAYNTASGATVTDHVTIERCVFECLPTGRSPLKVGGVPDVADASSTMTLKVSNSVFNLINGVDNRETVALDTQDDTADRRFSATFDHCTIAFGGNDQCGFRLRENQSVINVRNCIVDGDGGGHVALRGWRGTIISATNLLNATAPTEVAGGGAVLLSGNEILGASAEFEDRLGGDLRLTSISPALNVGEDLGYATDILGNARPAPTGSNPDLGAYERDINAAVQDWVLY